MEELEVRVRNLENDLINIRKQLKRDIDWWKIQAEKDPNDPYYKGASDTLKAFSNEIEFYFSHISSAFARNFIREANRNLKEEVDADSCTLLEESIVDGSIDYVMYEDRFGRQWQIRKKGDGYSKTEYVKE